MFLEPYPAMLRYPKLGSMFVFLTPDKPVKNLQRFGDDFCSEAQPTFGNSMPLVFQ